MPIHDSDSELGQSNGTPNNSPEITNWYTAAIKNGTKIGRNTGVQVKSDEQFIKGNKEVLKLLRQGTLFERL